MIEAEQKRHARAHAHAAENRFFDVFVAAHAQDVARHVFEAERCRRFVRTSVAPNIHGDDFEVSREMSDLVHPEIMVKGIGMDHYKWKSFTGDFVIDFNAVGCAVGHGC